ncbi:MAG: hypothetical protein ACOYZ6_09680 [Chloroflexota bacterium]
MKRLLVGVFVILVLLTVTVTRMVKINGKVIWVSAFPDRGWVINEEARDILAELAGESGNEGWVIVYLPVAYKETKVGYGRGDDPPLYYAEWSRWRQIPVLRIYVNWGLWREYSESKRDQGLAVIITKELQEFWQAGEVGKTVERKALSGEIMPWGLWAWGRGDE